MLIVLCGPAYSGKSVLASAFADAGAVVVSLDEINARRGLWGGDGIPGEEWVATHGIAREEAAAAVSARRHVVIDDTASLRSVRDGWRDLASSLGVDHRLVVLDVGRDILLRRHAESRATSVRRPLADAVLAEHLETFEQPAPDEDALTVGPGDDPGSLARRLLAPAQPDPSPPDPGS